MSRKGLLVIVGGVISALLLPLVSSAFEVYLPPDYCETLPPGLEDPIMCPPSSSPTPTPDQSQVRHPVLIVPGLGASYNKDLMIKNESGGEWTFAPFLDWYEPLLDRLEQEGYQEGVDLFVVHYDWRQANDESAQEYLEPAIAQAKNINNASFVDIVAHSMGGIVARAYIQGGNYNDDVDQLVMLGTPNAGAANAYIPWEGGDFPSSWGALSRQWITRIESAMNKQGIAKLDPPISFRTFFPSLRDLLPTVNFVHRDDTHIATTSRNYFLEALNAQASWESSVRQVITVAGENLPTLDQIAVGEANNRTAEDIALARWRDGHPLQVPPVADSTAGDQTVLKDSVQAAGLIHHALAGADHSALPERAQNLVATALLPHTPHGDFVPSGTRFASAMSVDVYSPVMPTIHGPSGEILSENTNTFNHAIFDWDPEDPQGIKLLTIADPPVGDYRIELDGNGTGEYSVVTTFADADETAVSNRAGVATPDTQVEIPLKITESTSSLVDDSDAANLLVRIETLAAQAKKDKLWKGNEEHLIKHPAKKAQEALKHYVKELSKADKEAGKSADKAQEKASQHYDTYRRYVSELHQNVQQLTVPSGHESVLHELQSLITALQ